MNFSVTYHPGKQQNILTDKESGARFWSVSGNNLQFTRFEVLPHTIFKKHKHDSEQITHVLTGELFFEIEKIIFKLCGGDSIVIPGNKEHAVWTEALPAVVVDAWSPINEMYLTN